MAELTSWNNANGASSSGDRVPTRPQQFNPFLDFRVRFVSVASGAATISHLVRGVYLPKGLHPR